jgi:hypothetical protein
MKVTSNVKVSNNFPQLKRRIHEGAIPRALKEAAEDGARVSRTIARSRVETGAMADIKVAPPRRDVKGWNVIFFSPAYYAWFQEKGTLGNRRGRLKQPGRSSRDRSPGTGIEPLNFLAKGRTAARKSLMEHLRREISRIP